MPYPKFELRFRRAIEAGGVAILCERQRLTTSDGNMFPGQTSDVAREQGDGAWLIVIDNPYGGAGVN